MVTWLQLRTVPLRTNKVHRQLHPYLPSPSRRSPSFMFQHLLVLLISKDLVMGIARRAPSTA